MFACVRMCVGGFFFRFLFAQFHWDAVESMIYCLLRYNHCQSMKIVHWIKHPHFVYTFVEYQMNVLEPFTEYLLSENHNMEKRLSLFMCLYRMLYVQQARDQIHQTTFCSSMPKLLFRTSVDHVWLLKMLDVTLNYMHCTLFFITIKLTNDFFCHFFFTLFSDLWALLKLPITLFA